MSVDARRPMTENVAEAVQRPPQIKSNARRQMLVESIPPDMCAAVALRLSSHARTLAKDRGSAPRLHRDRHLQRQPASPTISSRCHVKTRPVVSLDLYDGIRHNALNILVSAGLIVLFTSGSG